MPQPQYGQPWLDVEEKGLAKVDDVSMSTLRSGSPLRPALRGIRMPHPSIEVEMALPREHVHPGLEGLERALCPVYTA